MAPMSSTTKRQSDMTSSMSADKVQKASCSAGGPAKGGEPAKDEMEKDNTDKHDKDKKENKKTSRAEE